MKEKEMELIGGWIFDVITKYSNIKIPENKDERKVFISNFYKRIGKDSLLKDINRKVKIICSQFPVS